MMQAIEEECPMKREYPSRPIPAVAAVIFSGTKVLLVKRANPPSEGQWSLPGGAIQLGETWREALEREILEEAGIGIEVKSLVAVVDRIVRDKQHRIRYHYIILDYWAEYASGSAQASSDAMDVRWLEIPDLEALGVSEDTVRVIKLAREMRRAANSRAIANRGETCSFTL